MTELRPKKEILNWLQAHRSMNSFTGIVLKNGEWFSGRANVTDYEVTTTWKKCRRPPAAGAGVLLQCTEVLHGPRAPVLGRIFPHRRTADAPRMERHGRWRGCRFYAKAVLRKAKRENNLVDDRPPLYFGVNVPRSFILEHILEGGSGESIGDEFWPRVKPKKTR